jgi:hypothetical protein
MVPSGSRTIAVLARMHWTLVKVLVPVRSLAAIMEIYLLFSIYVNLTVLDWLANSVPQTVDVGLHRVDWAQTIIKLFEEGRSGISADWH